LLAAGKSAFSAGQGLLTDMLEGRNFKQSLIARSKGAGRALVKQAKSSASNYLSNLNNKSTVKRARTIGQRGGRRKRGAQGESGKKKKKQKRSRATLF
jgi:hypothetical protein